MNLPTSLPRLKGRSPAIAVAVTGALLLVLPSCAFPPYRQTNLGLGLPAGFNGVTSPENSAQLRVDEFYHDPVLTGLVCQALATNRDLKILEEDVQIARAEILTRLGGFLPLVGFRSGAGLEKPSFFMPDGAAERQLLDPNGRHFPEPMGNFLGAFNLILPLDIWRELRNLRDGARQRYLAAIERRNYFVTRMVADIAENYYGLMALDMRIQNLNTIITLQQRSLEIAERNLAVGKDTDLPVQRFRAEVRKYQSEKLIVRQEIIETENRINFLAGRFPQAVDRDSAGFYDLTINTLNVGVPAQLLLNRPDIRQAERELVAAGLDVKVARAHFFPRLDITGSVGYQAFNPRYLFTPDALIGNVAGELTAPVLNKAAIRAEYRTANARQLESVYNYQRVILSAFTEVINRLAAVENYRSSIVIKRQQLAALEASVEIANKLFSAARTTYMDVLFAQRDLFEARRVLIDTKRQQLLAIVNTYQALGGGASVLCQPPERPLAVPEMPPLPELPQLPPPRPVKDQPEPMRLPEMPQLPGVGKEKDAPELPRLPEVPPLPAPRKENEAP